MSDSKEETICVISFDGKKIGWSSWKEKFLARAKKKGYKDVLLGKTHVVKDSVPIASNDPYKDEKLKAREDNKAAYADLILSINTLRLAGRIAFNLAKSSKSNDYPNGHAATAWQSLERKYNPKTTTSRTKLHKEFYGAKL